MSSSFVAPGPGQWVLDRSHYPGGATPISRWLLTEGFHEGFSVLFAELGLPAERIDVEFVHGFMYTRLRPLLGATKPPRRPPPAFALWFASRMLPEFRSRNKKAIATLRDRPSNDVVARWHRELRPRLQTTNERFQRIDPAMLDDDELQKYLDELLSVLRDNFVLHFWLHGHDLGPIAKYLYYASEWGLETDEAIGALAGASPSTSKPLADLVAIRAEAAAADCSMATLEDVRSASPKARELVDDYLRVRGHVLATGYDLYSPTLREMPELILETIKAAVPPRTHNIEGIAGNLRAQVPAVHQPKFDELLSDARAVMDMRDDNGPLTIEWPMGLLRRALLAAGERLVERGALIEKQHTFELTPAEARALFGGSLPPGPLMAGRAIQRLQMASLDPPTTLGPDEPPAPLHALPKALALQVAMVELAMKHVGLDSHRTRDELSGIGIGSQPYIGIARVASSPDQAFERLKPGDVLIVRATSPAFNALFDVCGAVVTVDGGALSHAAVLAREFGIPAVIGVSGALSIRDGSEIEVDPADGRVRVISP